MNESAAVNKNATKLNRPDELLQGAGALAWQAYNAMETTKRRHFEFLKVLDNKKKNYNIDPTEQDTQLLASLLQDHDEQVKRFTKESSMLKDLDVEQHTGLFVYIGAINQAADSRQVAH